MTRRAYIAIAVLIVLVLGSNDGWARRRPNSRHNQRTHRKHRRHLRRVVWSPLFPGSHEMLVRQNEMLDLLELPRIANDRELMQLVAQEELVEVESSEELVVAPNLKPNRRYCRLWTRDFLEDLSEAYYKEFGKPIVVTSLVRTAEQQRKLRRRNRNAAPHAGDTVSTHLTGVTADILKRGMTRKQHSWLEQYLMPLKQAGYIEPIEERRQPVFHIVVFNSYSEDRESEDDDAPQPPDPLTIAHGITN